VWHNLISNALKFTQYRDRREIGIDSSRSESETIYRISDNGAGFDMKYADRLFTPFYRMHEIEEYKGTGVGLAIVNRIVRLHGGRAWAESKADEGAVFYFALPANEKNKA
jgi:light-regulated signal transduction histidine kinase (bacteriophytochrome)